MAFYEIAFSGKLVPGARLELVQANLAKLFQADAQRIVMLFSGRRMVLKNNLDEAAAQKYRLALEQAGALVEVSPMGARIERAEWVSSPPEEASATAVASPAPGRLRVAPRDEYMAAFAAVDAPDFGIAPIGVDLQDAKPAPTPPSFDFSSLSLAPAGSDMGQAKKTPQGPELDTSYLRLEERK